MVTSNKKAEKPCPLWTERQKLGHLVQVLEVLGESPCSGLQMAAFLQSLHTETRRNPTALSKVETLMLGRKDC